MMTQPNADLGFWLWNYRWVIDDEHACPKIFIIDGLRIEKIVPNSNLLMMVHFLFAIRDKFIQTKRDDKVSQSPGVP